MDNDFNLIYKVRMQGFFLLEKIDWGCGGGGYELN